MKKKLDIEVRVGCVRFCIKMEGRSLCMFLFGLY